jgi:hypothetical protein
VKADGLKVFLCNQFGPRNTFSVKMWSGDSNVLIDIDANADPEDIHDCQLAL